MVDQQELFGLYAMDQYLRENAEIATWKDMFNYLFGCLKLVRDNGGDVDGFIDMVCGSFRDHFNAPDMVVYGLRQELEQCLQTM